VLSNYVLFDAVSIGDFSIFIAVVLLAKHVTISVLSGVSAVINFVVILIGFYAAYNAGVHPAFFRLSFYFSLVFFVISLQKIYFEKFFYVYIYCCIFFSVSLILQRAVYQLLGFSIPLQLPLPYYEADTLEIVNDIYRSGGWFREPSYFAIFIVPAYSFNIVSGSIRIFVFCFSVLY
jgi:hypothetical protein